MARRTFTTEFKTAAARLVTEQGYSRKEAAQSLGVDAASIRAWIRLDSPVHHGCPAAPADAAALRVENRRLREENGRLLKECEIFKEATAALTRQFL